MNSKYLDEVIEQTDLDYEEAVEMIEREKKAMYVCLRYHSHPTRPQWLIETIGTVWIVGMSML